MLQSILEILLRVKGGTQSKAELGKVQKSVKSLSGMAKELGLALGLARLSAWAKLPTIWHNLSAHPATRW